MIRDIHLLHLHAGPQALVAQIHNRYWPLRVKEAIRRVLRKRIKCFRCRPISQEQLIEDLPSHRITPSRAFFHTGVDYAGPFKIKLSRTTTGKAYICLFVCMATKAVHLERLTSLNTEAFLNVFKRFIAGRGLCNDLYSGNGSNFVVF